VIISACACGLSSAPVPTADAQEVKPGEPERPGNAVDEIDFVKEVRPLLRTRCISCHGPEESESGLRLDQQKRALEGGDNGRIIVPGKPAESRLLRIVAGQDDEVGAMPPEGEGTPLSSDEIAVLKAWIAQGAVWPNEAESSDRSSHWSYQPIAGLIQDLKRRGLLDSTLLVFAGEFGRTPLWENRGGTQSKNIGRDHHPFGFSVFMAGGGSKGGVVHGETDEIGWAPIKDPVHINDFHATIMHLFGFDHMHFTHRFRGLNVRLTDQGGTVLKELLT
jgi:hypothetical protein